MKHPSLFGVRMAPSADGRTFSVVAVKGHFQVAAALRLRGGLWYGELRVNCAGVYFAPRGFKTLRAASDSLAGVAGELSWAADLLTEGEGAPIAPELCGASDQ